MACYEICEHKKEASMLRKRLAELDPDRVKAVLEKSRESQLRAVNERDYARKRVREQEERIRKLLDKIESLKDKLVWAEEDWEKERKAGISARKSQKHQIDELEKKLSTAVWKLDKLKRDLEKAHKKELKQQKEEYEKKIRELEERYQKEIAAKDAVIETLCGQPCSVGRKVDAGSTKADSTNSSVPPGQDPNHATITNNRESTGRTQGGQPGHKAQPRKKFNPDHVVKLPPPEEVVKNPDAYYCIGEISKQVVSVRIAIEVTEYVALQYRNHKTRNVIHSEFPEGVGHLEVNYDESVESLAAYLHSVCNVPYNKIQELFNEAVDSTLPISIGKLAGLEKKFSSLSREDRNEIWGKLFRSKTMNLDGTCMRVNGKQRQVLVMRSGGTVMYRMTGCKGDKALEGTPVEHYDGIVISDGESTFTKLGRKRQGCLVHEGRYVRHAEDVAPGLEWPGEMRGLLKELQHRRNEDVAKGIWKMPEKEKQKVIERYEGVIKKGLDEYGKLCGKLLTQQLLSNRKRLQKFADTYSLDFDFLKREHDTAAPDVHNSETQKALRKDINTLIRLMADKDDYLLFLSDYTIPPHNNDAEKSARTVKIHAKPNGGMRSEEYAGYYADTATVMETEHMQGRSRYAMLKSVFRRGTNAMTGKGKIQE